MREFLSKPLVSGDYLPFDFGPWTPPRWTLLLVIGLLGVSRALRVAATPGAGSPAMRFVRALPLSFGASLVLTLLFCVWSFIFALVGAFVIGVILHLFGMDPGPKPVARIIVTWLGLAIGLFLAAWTVLRAPRDAEAPNS